MFTRFILKILKLLLNIPFPIEGFGFGLLGGATGIFKQAYEGAANEGIQGLVSGIGKGIVGAVTKPVVGLLDLTSETARAVRDSSRRYVRFVVNKLFFYLFFFLFVYLKSYIVLTCNSITIKKLNTTQIIQNFKSNCASFFFI